MNQIRIEKLQNQIKARVANLVAHELNDPGLGFVTINHVKMDREIAICRIYWSVLGDEKVRRRNAEALERARGFVRREIAAVMHTRTVPQVQFLFDESIEGSMRIARILDEERQGRESRGAEGEEGEEG